MPKSSKRNGFTLIELMVVMAIIALLASIGFVSYSKAQIASRDSRRKQDLRSIQVALELYYQINKRYPCSSSSGNGWQLSSPSSWWLNDQVNATVPSCGSVAFDTNFINQLPSDPSGNAGDPRQAGNFGYGYFGGAICSFNPGQYFILATQLENGNDSQTIKNSNPLYCDGSTKFWTDHGTGNGGPYGPNTFVITSQ